MKKPFTLAEHLKNYSLVAGSVLASSLAASGQVVYKDINPDVELGGTVPASFPYDSSFALDLNNDGITDFNLKLSIYSQTAQNDLLFKENIDGGVNLVNAVFTYTIEYVPFVIKLNCEDSVPPNAYVYGAHAGDFAFQFANSAQYAWKNLTNKYVGLKFLIGSEAHYGWLHLDVNTADSVPNIIVKDFAYEETANKKIEVCDTGFALLVETPVNEGAFQIFPNPSTGIGVLNLQQPLTGALELKLTDLTGKEIYLGKLQMDGYKTEIPFDFSHVSGGTYFIQLKSGNLLLTQKWMKK